MSPEETKIITLPDRHVPPAPKQAVTPPSNPEYEQSVLGAVLVRPEVMAMVADILQPADFYLEAHGRIYQAMLDLYGRGDPVDLVTVTGLVKERGQLDGVGGPDFLAGLSEAVGFATNGEFYARKVKELADLRRYKALGVKLAGAKTPGDAAVICEQIKVEQAKRAAGATGLQTITAKDLGAKEFPPRRWAIPDLITEGVTILAGKPKAGKSWLALNIAVAVATGGKALGKIQVEQGGVLYLAMEDSERRLKERLKKIVGPDEPFPEGLHIITATGFPPLHNGGLIALDAWLKDHPEVKLVIIDTLGRVKPARGRHQDAYDHDTLVISALQKISFDHQTAFLVIHHTKKAGVDDFVDEVSGTFGLTGAADAIVVLSRVARGRLDGILKLTGRDVEEQELPLKFDPLLGTWVITDDGDVVKAGRSMERNTLIDFVEGFPGKTPTEISKILAKKPENVKSLLWRMSADGEVRALNGKYYPIR
jgi:Mrp family chromosome partitioning ATPase